MAAVARLRHCVRPIAQGRSTRIAPAACMALRVLGFVVVAAPTRRSAARKRWHPGCYFTAVEIRSSRLSGRFHASLLSAAGTMRLTRFVRPCTVRATRRSTSVSSTGM